MPLQGNYLFNFKIKKNNLNQQKYKDKKNRMDKSNKEPDEVVEWIIDFKSDHQQEKFV